MVKMMGVMDHRSWRELDAGKYFSKEEQMLQKDVCKC